MRHSSRHIVLWRTLEPSCHIVRSVRGFVIGYCHTTTDIFRLLGTCLCRDTSLKNNGMLAQGRRFFFTLDIRHSSVSQLCAHAPGSRVVRGVQAVVSTVFNDSMDNIKNAHVSVTCEFHSEHIGTRSLEHDVNDMNEDGSSMSPRLRKA